MMADPSQFTMWFWMSSTAVCFGLMLIFWAKWRHARFDLRREHKYRVNADDTCEHYFMRNIALERANKELTDEINALRLGKANSSSYEQALAAQDALREAMKP